MFYAGEDRVPSPGAADALHGCLLDVFGEVQPGAEMIAMAVENDGFCLVLGAGHRLCNGLDETVTDGIALFGPVEPDVSDLVAKLIGDEVARRCVGHCASTPS